MERGNTKKLKLVNNVLTDGTWNFQTLWATGKLELLRYEMKRFRYTLKNRPLRNPQKRFRRFENVSKCVKMLKKRIFNSTEPLKVLSADTRESRHG